MSNNRANKKIKMNYITKRMMLVFVFLPFMLHASTNIVFQYSSPTNVLRSIVQEKYDIFWNTDIQDIDTNKYSNAINTLFIAPWVFDTPNYRLTRTPRPIPKDIEPQPYNNQ